MNSLHTDNAGPTWPAMKSDLVGRPVWCIALIWAICQIWWVKYPPMIDLPQHVAQVALLGDLVSGRSPWSDEVWINLKTPYLIGYGLTYLLSGVFTPLMAFKVLITLAAGAFLAAAWCLRRICGADRAMDWLVVGAFTGYAYYWGFVTFLVASPILLVFVMLVNRVCTAERPGLASSGMAVLGVALLLSHGLMFAFAWGIAAAMLLVHFPRQRIRVWLARAWPLVAMAGVALFYFYMARSTEQAINGGISNSIDFDFTPIDRLWTILNLPLDHKAGKAVSLLTLSLIAAPWLMGLRPVTRLTHPGVIFFAVTMGVLILVPGSLMDTGFVSPRFALFFFPAYACLFARPVGTQIRWDTLRKHIAMTVMVGVTTLVFAHRAHVAYLYDEEMATLEQVLRAAEPQQRMAYLPIDDHLNAKREDSLFVHAGAYYQASNQGLVDFNFAWFAPQIVRFRPEHRPAIKVGFEWEPEKFDWKRHQGERYGLFLFRGGTLAIQQQLLAQSGCHAPLKAAQGNWALYGRPVCGVK